MLVFTSWLEKSRYRRPAWSHTVEPRPPAITSGLRCACADHEWKTWSRSSRSAVASSSVLMVLLLDGADRARAPSPTPARGRSLAAGLECDLDRLEALTRHVDTLVLQLGQGLLDVLVGVRLGVRLGRDDRG